MKNRYKNLRDYGIIGNLETCALVGRDGSVDWCCFPYIDSPSVFGALLDVERGGFFMIAPEGNFQSTQRYRGTTNVLATTFVSESGKAELIDFMPVMDPNSDDGENGHRAILRALHCLEGEMTFDARFEPRFDYGAFRPRFELLENSVHAFTDTRSLRLNSTSPFLLHENGARAHLKIKQGDRRWFRVQYGNEPWSVERCESLLHEVTAYWEKAIADSKVGRPIFSGEYMDQVIRSNLAVALLTNPKTGGVAAAATTSLPEVVGGTRNWDYRYCWLRDSSFTVQAFEHLGHPEKVRDYARWLTNACSNDEECRNPSQVKIAYTQNGKLLPRERDLEHLRGYKSSAPVRVGNSASTQVQADIFGEMINTFFIAARQDGGLMHGNWPFIRAVAEHVRDSWKEQGAGIWELRGAQRHLTYSKLMCWVALDRSLKLARLLGKEGDLEKWRATCEEIRQTVLSRGFNANLNSFVQTFDSEDLDASCLLIPLMGLLPGDDPRVAGTIDAVKKHLSCGNGLVYRYLNDDGLPGREGAFILCSFWLVKALATAGRIEEAEETFHNVLEAIKGPLGLFSEEIDPESGLLLGNYPQAYSHVGFINAALYLGRMQNKEHPVLSASGEE